MASADPVTKLLELLSKDGKLSITQACEAALLAERIKPMHFQSPEDGDLFVGWVRSALWDFSTTPDRVLAKIPEALEPIWKILATPTSVQVFETHHLFLFISLHSTFLCLWRFYIVQSSSC